MSVRLAGLTVVLAVLFAVINPAPAAAHLVGTGGSPTNYQASVTGIRPSVPDVAVTVGLGGQWVRVANQGAGQIVVIGYQGEPFLRLLENRVQVNELSTTAVETGQTQGTPSQELGGEPKWVQLRAADSATWADARVEPSSQTSDQPGQTSGSWRLPLVVDGQQVTVLGTWERVAPPSPWPWVAALVLLAASVAAIGWQRDWHRPMAAAVTIGILAFVAHLVGTAFIPQEGGQAFGWIGVGAVGAFSLLIGTVAVASTLRGTDTAPDRLVTVGIMVLLLAATDISVLWNSQLPFAGPAALDRGLTVLTYATALGLLVGGIHLVRQARASRRA